MGSNHYPRDVAQQILFRVLSEVDDLTDAEQIPIVLVALTKVYELRSVAYLGSGFGERPGRDPYLAVTYSPEWVDHYKTRSFAEIDPAIQIGMRRLLPIDWAEFDREDKKVRELFGEAAEFGLGRQGLSVPVHGHNCDRGLLSITSDAKEKDWKYLRLHYMRDFQILALHLHQAILRIENRQAAVAISLSPRERECLLWTAEGKTCWECATILGLAERTVRFYLESARHKLGAANTTHAVNKATRANLLRELP